MCDLAEGEESKTDTAEVGSDAALRDFWMLVGSLEAASEHPLAATITQEARTIATALKPVTDAQNVAGSGIEGMVDGRAVAAGKMSWIQKDVLGKESLDSHMKVTDRTSIQFNSIQFNPMSSCLFDSTQ